MMSWQLRAAYPDAGTAMEQLVSLNHDTGDMECTNRPVVAAAYATY